MGGSGVPLLQVISVNTTPPSAHHTWSWPWAVHSGSVSWFFPVWHFAFGFSQHVVHVEQSEAAPESTHVPSLHVSVCVWSTHTPAGLACSYLHPAGTRE